MTWVIQNALQHDLAQMVLQGAIVDGETAWVSAGEGGLLINGVEAKAA